jgi:hypothetical protein
LALVAVTTTVGVPVDPAAPWTRKVTEAGKLVPTPVATNVAVTVADPPAAIVVGLTAKVPVASAAAPWT